MLNSFWNLCRACPSMPIDKLNSEYRTHFKWHDTYHAPIQEAVRKLPLTEPSTAMISEPSFPRKKKHPELAYRTHGVLRMVNGDSSDSLEAAEASMSKDNADGRARSEERGRGRRDSPRSKSVDPYLGRRRPHVELIAATATTFGTVAPVNRHRYTWRVPLHETGTTFVPQLMTQSYPPGKYSYPPLEGGAPVQQVAPPPSQQPSASSCRIIGNPHPQAAAVEDEEGPPPTTASGIPKLSEYRSQFHWRSKDKKGDRSAAPPDVVVAENNCHPRKSISLGAIQAVQQQQATMMKNGIDHSGDDSAARTGANEAPNADEEDDKTGPGKLRKFKTEYKAKFKSPTKYMFIDGSWKKPQEQQVTKKIDNQQAGWYGEVLELRKKAGEYKTRAWGGNLAPEHIAQLWEQVAQRRVLSALALATTPRKKIDHEEQTSARIPSAARHHLERTTPAPGELGVLLTSPTRDHKLEPIQMQKSMRDTSAGKERERTPSGKSRISPKISPRIGEVKSGPIAAGSIIPFSTTTTSTSPASRSQPHSTLTTTSTKPKSAAAIVGKGRDQEEALPKPHAVKSKPVSKPAVQQQTQEPAQPKPVEKAPHKSMVNGDDNYYNDVIDVEKDDFAVKKREEDEPIAYPTSPPGPTQVRSPEQILVHSPEPVQWTVPIQPGIQWTGSPRIEGDGIKVLMKEDPVSPPSLASMQHVHHPGVTVLPQSDISGFLHLNGNSEYTNDLETSEF